MDEGNDLDVKPTNLQCNVCGEREFYTKGGYYFCLECGTKTEEARLVERERDEGQDDIKHVRKQKVHTLKTDKVHLTSWECYNYILRGLVDDLLSYGVKEELKLMCLQIWAAYLRHMQVAFFSKDSAELPKLSVRYLKSDAETIYNHRRAKKRKRKTSGSSVDTHNSSNQSSNREWRKAKRKLDDSIYSDSTAATTTISNSSSSASTSMQPIRLNYNNRARKSLKKFMPAKHIQKHENDTENLLTCHKQPKVRDLHRLDYMVSVLSIKQIYAIIGIALNLIEDDMQLSDFVRHIQEGHISMKNVLQYFPENIARNGIEMLKKIDFYKYPDKYTDKNLREHIGVLCKNIGIRKFKCPDMIKLVERYVEELCLPADVAIFAMHLINLLPPRFEIRAAVGYPNYEARAMAYIIYVLKLLFGLDGHKEQLISLNTKNMNKKINHFNSIYNENESPLFVWSDWVQYIEMRKVLISQFNSDFCKQYKQTPSTAQFLEQMHDEVNQRDEQTELLTDDLNTSAIKQHLDVFKAIFKDFTKKEENSKMSQHIKFSPSFTPASSYLKTILLHFKSNANLLEDQRIEIPDFMQVDHKRFNIKAFVEVKPCVEYFASKGYKMNVIEVPVTTNRTYVGVFRPPPTASRGVEQYLRVQRADFNIDEQKWKERVTNEVVPSTDDLEFKKELESYQPGYLRRRVNASRRNQLKNKESFIEFEGEVPSTELKLENNDFNSAASYEILTEGNMTPLASKFAKVLSKPRRHLGKLNILQNLNDEENLINERPFDEIKLDIIKQELEEKSLNFLISNMDCWLLMGHILMLTKTQKQQLRDKFPRSFCWLLETCAETLGVDWSIIYQQLLVIELMFGEGIESLNNFDGCIQYKYNNPIKDFNTLINTYREIW
ncbi:TATA box-binding protein-associated factor RNA polymerase I subunit B isoform X1 [Glossina fuscipes]|uniref:TATA box-binding protein-associated factor RNA polymerase I subunit B isoform X1 n=1 Tax=Glossina fuscipes TaxID=7396 RepID=A0A9C5ZA77_9MUSC|nr:TATA box-binding protein-associated factor RNA polymerase I subunit B isoform X1 [Glossina fuscipes]XP_037894878.1 TATA box-binding protein-associated factor RNA polymerase I subunit B isoform X1 [Glossina fuscipes]